MLNLQLDLNLDLPAAVGFRHSPSNLPTMRVPALLPGYKYQLYLSFDEKGGNTRSAGVTDYHYSPDQEEHTHKAPYEQGIVNVLQEKGYQVSSSGSGSGSNNSSSSSSMNSFRGVKDSKMFLFDVTEAYRYMKAVQTFYL